MLDFFSELLRKRGAAYVLAEVLSRYFRVTIEGFENLPLKGPALFVPNHSGFVAADAVILSHMIHKMCDRKPNILAHRGFFDLSKTEAAIARSFGLRKATSFNGMSLLKQRHLVILFPEGELGNFKSSVLKYRLQKFQPGFVRMALLQDVPVIPTLIIGAEESHLNVGYIDLDRFIKKLRIPLPLNLLPLPSKWKIRFLPPINMREQIPMEQREDKAVIQRTARKVRVYMQRELKNEIKKRDFIFFPTPEWLKPYVS